MTIRERWQRIRAGKSSAGGMKTGDGNGKGLTSPPRERLSPITTAPSLRPHHGPQSSEETSGRSPNRNFLTRTLTWRFNNHTTIDGTSPPGQGEPRPLRREGGEKRHRRKPSKYPGRCSPPPLTSRPQLATSRSEPVRYPPPLRPEAGDNHHQHHHSAPPPQPQAQPQPQPQGIAIPTTTQENRTPSPTKKKKPHNPHPHHNHNLHISAAAAAAAAAAATSSLKRNRTNPKEKAARKKKGIRQRQREREREINRHIFGPEQQEHQELLNNYTFPVPVEPSPAEQRKKNMGKDGFLDDEGHDGDDEGYCAGAGAGGERHRRKSSNISPYSCSRPGSLSGSTVGGGAGATNMTVGMGGLSLGEMGMMGHWTRDLNGDGPWGGFEVSENR